MYYTITIHYNGREITERRNVTLTDLQPPPLVRCNGSIINIKIGNQLRSATSGC